MKVVPHPPYTKDLTPCDFWMFPKLKSELKGRRFEDIEELKEVSQKASQEVLKGFTGDDFSECFKKSEKRLDRCVGAEAYILNNRSSFCM